METFDFKSLEEVGEGITQGEDWTFADFVYGAHLEEHWGVGLGNVPDGDKAT